MGTSLPGAGLLGEDRMLRTPDGRLLRAMVRGHGDGLVVLESGLGMSGLYWGLVQPGIAEHARVVAYERAGLGGSDPDPRPRGLERLADDLDVVIEAFPHRRLTLVGHSWGGPIVRTAAARRLVAGRPLDGIVLVDQTDEHADLYFSFLARALFAVQAATTVPFARMGVLSALSKGMVHGLPEPLDRAVLEASCSLTAAKETRAELSRLIPELRRLRDHPLSLGDVPVRVISGHASPSGRRASDQRIRAALTAAHAATALRHPNAQLVPADRSEHLIPATEPELIVAQVRALLDG